MNVPRRRRPRALIVALGFSLAAHAAILPFLRVPAAARTAPTQVPTIVDLLHPTPRPTRKPAPPRPRPIVAHPRVVPRLPRVVAVVAPRAHTFASSTVANAAPKSGAARFGNGRRPGDGRQEVVGTTETGAPQASAAPESEAATPPGTPVPIESTCPNQPHDATVTDAVTPDRPLAAEEEGAVGRVVVAVEIARDGSVARASVHASSGFAALDRAAVEAAARARYAPASDGCEAIAGTYLYVVDFSE